MTDVIAALDRVFGGFTPEQGVSDFELDAAEQRLGIALPPALRALYRVTGRHPFHSACNYLVPPEELAVRTRNGAIALLRRDGDLTVPALDEATFREMERQAALEPRAWAFLAPRDR